MNDELIQVLSLLLPCPVLFVAEFYRDAATLTLLVLGVPRNSGNKMDWFDSFDADCLTLFPFCYPSFAVWR